MPIVLDEAPSSVADGAPAGASAEDAGGAPARVGCSVGCCGGVDAAPDVLACCTCARSSAEVGGLFRILIIEPRSTDCDAMIIENNYRAIGARG